MKKIYDVFINGTYAGYYWAHSAKQAIAMYIAEQGETNAEITTQRAG